VLELDDGAVQSALEVFNAYAKRTEVG